MKSPFPGMDPYLEAYWSSVHGKLVIYAGESLNSLLPPDLVANTEERVGIEVDAEDAGFLSPDVSIMHAYSQASSSKGGVTQALASYKLVALADVPRERFIEVTTTDGSKLITVIEFISPTNKNSGRADFMRKREVLLGGGVNFVEIDLTRGGDWRKLLLPQECPPEAVSAYRYTTRIPHDSEIAYFQPISIRQPLPLIPIPLRQGEAEVALPLQSLIEQCYRVGRYDRRLRYDFPPEPPLDEADAAWARQLIADAKRSAT